MTDTLAFRVTQASLNQTALDWPRNMASHFAAINAGAAEGSDAVFMPELSLTGYEVNDDFQRTDNSRIYEALTEIAAYAHAKDPDMIVSVGHPWRLQLREAFGNAADPDILKNPLYDRLSLPFNVQTLIAGGRIVAMTAKANLYRNERGYENRYFNEWSFRDAAEAARLMGVTGAYGTLPVTLPGGETVPFGRPLVYVTDDAGNSYIHAMAICEEKWAATKFDGAPHDDSRYERLNIIPSIARHLGTKKGVMLEIANASPPALLKQDKHMHLNELASRYADAVIDTDGLGTSGATFAQFGHRLIAQDGKTIAAGPRMKFGEIATTTSTVRLHKADPLLEARTHARLERNFRDVNAAPETALSWTLPDKSAAWDDPQNPNRWKEERIRNQALWMFDYMRKTKSRGIAEALSGGKDSAFNCAMARVMVELAMHDLGVPGFCAAMGHLPYNDEILAAFKTGGKDAAVETCMKHMLTAVYMGTNNSSFETWNAAKTLIEGGMKEDGTPFPGIGGKFLERNVQDLVTVSAFIFGTENSTKIAADRKRDILEELGRFVHASTHDHTPQHMQDWADKIRADYPELEALTSAALPGNGVAYENFQARVRGVLIMAIANVEAKMAVANPNLDEAYGAYATFQGDLHSGTVNWNAGLHKIDQEALMEYLEEHGIPGVMKPVHSLAPANRNRPSAELQPKKGDKVVQYDEDALQGTFAQKAALSRLRHHTKIATKDGERWLNAGEIFAQAKLNAAFDGMDDNRLFNAVAYFTDRWEGPAQHKIHATPIANTFGENVDKQTSLRTPNLSGGSRDEIIQLAIRLLYDWARQDMLIWDMATKKELLKRAWTDKGFAETFLHKIRNRDPALPQMSYNLRGLYAEIKAQGWSKPFSAATQHNPALDLP